jgi:ABC-2 type transport system permease protein
MLWYKSWLETRWRFVTGAVVLMCSSAGVVLMYPKVLELMPLVPTLQVGGEIGRRIREGVELARDYRGFVWWQGFRQNLPQMATLFAVLLGTGGLLSQTSGGGILFTLSMPVSRARLLGTRAATGLAELLVLVFAAAMLIPVLSPLIGQTYGFGGALVHAFCLFVACTVFFSLAFLLSTVFTDVWRPLTIALGIAIAIALVEQVFREASRHSIFGVMTGELYFREGRLPWTGLFLSAAASAAMLYGATVTTRHRDF